MKTLKQILSIAVLGTLTLSATAQTWEVPKNYVLDKKEDYAKYEKDVINGSNWLETSPYNKEAAKRKEAGAFLLKWIMGSPNVTIELNANTLTFNDKNPDFLTLFMGGWTRFVLENPASADDKVKGTLAGIKSVLKVYKAGNGVKKDKNVDKLVKLEADGKLEKWIEDQLKKK